MNAGDLTGPLPGTEEGKQCRSGITFEKDTESCTVTFVAYRCGETKLSIQLVFWNTAFLLFYQILRSAWESTVQVPELSTLTSGAEVIPNAD